MAPVFSRSEIENLKLARKNGESNEGQSRQCVTLTYMALKAVINNCCFFFKTNYFTQLKYLPNNLTQRILAIIFATRDYCVKHRDSMVMSLLGPSVTEFNYLMVWEPDEEDAKGFDNLAYLCWKCPNLKELKMIWRQQTKKPELQPHLINIVGDICSLTNLTCLVAKELTCSIKDLWLIQENLIKLKHLAITVPIKFEMDAVEPFAGMLNLSRLELCQPNGFKEDCVEALVLCAGSITNLQTFFVDCSEGNLFVEKYAAQFPQKQLHLLSKVKIQNCLNIPWPNFLTCKDLELDGVRDNISTFAAISFPLQELTLVNCRVGCMYQLLDIFGQNVKQLYISDPLSNDDGKLLCLNELMFRCPIMEDLEFNMLEDYFTAFFDNNMTGCVPLREEHFKNLRYLQFTGCQDAVDSEYLDMYKNIFCLVKEVQYLQVQFVLFAKAGLLALAEDENCFKKVQQLFVSTYYYQDEADCEFVFLFVKKMMLRSLVLKEINISSVYFENEDDGLCLHREEMHSLSDEIKPYAMELGISFKHEDDMV